MVHFENSYDPFLVIFSFLIAIGASNAAFTCLNRMKSDSKYRIHWQTAAALSFGFGVWTMHFVGMAALQLPVSVAYNLPLTALSIVFIFIAAWLAFGIVGVEQASIGQILLGGTLLGVGVGAMHYTGMFSLRSGAEMILNLPMVGVSALVAVVLSSVGLWLLNNNLWENLPYRNILVTSIVGLAVPLMHYTGMLASQFAVSNRSNNSLPSLNGSALSLDLFLLLALLSMVVPFVANALIPQQADRF
jgi:diguanylate cyclase